jgi:pyrroloquinoline quinone (PQQ) biosynthesis protein C
MLQKVSDGTSIVRSFARGALFPEQEETPEHFGMFFRQCDQVLEKLRRRVEVGGVTEEQEQEFEKLLLKIGKEIISHPAISNNVYLRRFSEGVTFRQARHETQQFSIFAHSFDEAQAKLVANAPTFEAYQERLKVLLNEKGIPYKNGFEGELTGRWSLKHVHFIWLLRMAEGLGLGFEDVGKIWLADEGTRAFVDATSKYYASRDPNIQLGASFAIENWAANYLWKPWLSGMRKLNATLKKKINLGYLTYHEAEERHHSQATIDELLENFLEDWFDADEFLRGARGILDEGVSAYYLGQLSTLPEKEGNGWPESWPEAEEASLERAV